MTRLLCIVTLRWGRTLWKTRLVTWRDLVQFAGQARTGPIFSPLTLPKVKRRVVGVREFVVYDPFQMVKPTACRRVTPVVCIFDIGNIIGRAPVYLPIDLVGAPSSIISVWLFFSMWEVVGALPRFPFR